MKRNCIARCPDRQVSITLLKFAVLLSFFLLTVTGVMARQPDTARQDIPHYDPPYTKPVNTMIGEGGNNMKFDMAPETTPRVVQAAVRAIRTPMVPGPVQPDWASLKAYYRVPDWYKSAKFGICMHWGLYSVPAYHNEWYEKHMYSEGDVAKWHIEHYGPQDTFGYKDFIPLFTAKYFDPQAWAVLFKKSGARFFVPACQHHDGFALWDSKVTRFNSVNMGPHRDIIGELCKAVRAQGLKFGFTNHEIENFQFINPPAALREKMRREKTDLFDPAWKDFYHYADRSDTACRNFLVDWYHRNVELIDKYRPDILWFDNGIDQRYLDPLKLLVAAYYYNSAAKWGKQVTLNIKKAAYAPTGVNTATIGSVLDFEDKVPPGIRTGVWDVDTKIGSTWGYTKGMKVSGAAAIIRRLIDIVSKNGTMMLNISPRADGTLPQDQVATLLGIGAWLKVNGEAIYDTHNWVKYKEADYKGQTGISFTAGAAHVYAILQRQWPADSIKITAATRDMGTVRSVQLLTANGALPLQFSQDATGLRVMLPTAAPGVVAWVLKISGLTTGPDSTTPSGNPVGYGQ